MTGTMKATLAFLTVLGLTGTTFVNGLPTLSGPPKDDLTKGLNEDLQDFLRLIPVDEIQNVFFDYLSNDLEFQEAVDYILSAEFRQFVIEIESMNEVQEILNYLQNAGLDAYGFVNMINRYLNIPEISPRLKMIRAMRFTGGLSGFFKDVKALIPMDELQQLYKEKLETSPDFAALIQKLSSPEFQNLVNKIMAKPKLQEIITRLKSKGVNVQEIFDFLTSMLGLKFPQPQFRLRSADVTKSLKDDLEDFLMLIPVDQIKDLFFEYLANDEDFQEAMDYIMSNEFRQFVTEIESMPEVREMLNYLQNAGLDAYTFVNMINRYLSIPEISPSFRFLNGMKITGGLSGFLKDVKALIPIEQLKQLYNEKLENSEEFAALIQKLSSPEFQTLVNKVMAKPKFQEIITRLKSKGVNVQEIFDFLTSMLGLKFPQPQFRLRSAALTKSLKDDLEDFMQLIPVEKITDLFFEYLANDEEFQEAMDFIMSKEFAQFVVEIESMPEIRELLNYLENAGLDAYAFVNMLNRYLNIPEISPYFSVLRKMKITGGLSGFIKDIKRLIPEDELRELFEEKLQTSKEFAALIEKLRSPEFQSLVNKIMAKPKLQEILQRLKGKGVNVQELFNLLSSLLGLEFPSQSAMRR